MEEQAKGNLWVAAAIILAGVIIAGAVILTNNGTTNNNQGLNVNEEIPQVDLSAISPVTENDHIRGSVDAPIKVIEFSDPECPFCKRLQNVLNEVIKEYDGQVAWVYRHLLLVQSHPKAVTEAIATECVAELGGNEKFWEYLDRIYDNTTGNNSFDLDLLPQYAEDLGINKDEFITCLESDKYNDKISKQIEEGFKVGAEGTPYSIVITPSGEMIPVSGARPIEDWRKLFDMILQEESQEVQEVAE